MDKYIQQVRLTSHSPEETVIIGEQLGRLLIEGDVIALYGDLGTGKTVLAKGIARGVGIQDTVHSPTFTLVHEYMGPLALYHIDLYRIDESEIESLGLDEYMESGGVVVVEWAEKMKVLLPTERIDITLRKTNESTREIVITGQGARVETIIRGLVSNADACV